MRRLEKEAARLQGLLNAAGIECGRHSMTGMRKEVSLLKAEPALRRLRGTRPAGSRYMMSVAP